MIRICLKEWIRSVIRMIESVKKFELTEAVVTS